MLRYAVVVMLVLGLTIPAFGEINVNNGVNPQDITISLTIPCFTNIHWNTPGDSWDANDQTIMFNDVVQNGSNDGDWYNIQLTGAYGAATKASQDAFADGYYESYDAALFWLESNCDCTMDLISGGNLTNGSATLDTWYTVALTNNWLCTWNVDCGFINGGVRIYDGIIPVGGGMGCYPNDFDGDYVMELSNPTYFWGNQWAFPMVDHLGNTTYTANFEGFAQGTVLFHARALRNGLADPAGEYATTLTVNFSN